MRVSCVLDRILIDTEEAVEKVRGRKRGGICGGDEIVIERS